MASDLQVTLDRPQWAPGDLVTGQVRFALRRAATVKSVAAALEVCEDVQALVWSVDYGPGTTGGGAYQPVKAREVLATAPLVFKRGSAARFEAGDFPAGVFTWPFEVQVPANAPATVEREAPNEHVAVRAEICLKVAIAWGFDPDVRTPLVVVPRPPQPGPTAFRGVKVPRGTAQASALDLSLAATEVTRGAEVAGTVAFAAGGGAGPRRVRVRLIEEASGQAGSGRTIIETVLGEAAVVLPTLPGAPAAFRVKVPALAPPSYEGRRTALRHCVEAEADLGAKANPKTGTTLRIV